MHGISGQERMAIERLAAFFAPCSPTGRIFNGIRHLPFNLTKQLCCNSTALGRSDCSIGNRFGPSIRDWPQQQTGIIDSIGTVRSSRRNSSRRLSPLRKQRNYPGPFPEGDLLRWSGPSMQRVGCRLCPFVTPSPHSWGEGARRADEGPVFVSRAISLSPSANPTHLHPRRQCG